LAFNSCIRFGQCFCHLFDEFNLILLCNAFHCNQINCATTNEREQAVKVCALLFTALHSHFCCLFVALNVFLLYHTV
jgi:hypothetical protein